MKKIKNITYRNIIFAYVDDQDIKDFKKLMIKHRMNKSQMVRFLIRGKGR